MSALGDDKNEMPAYRQFDDATAEALLRGEAVSPEYEPVAEFVRDTRALGAVRVAPSRELAERLVTGDFTDVEAAVPPGASPWLASRRRFAEMGARARLATGAAVLLTAFTGMTVAGALPDGAQRTVDSIIKTVLPFADDEAGEPSDFADDDIAPSPDALEPASESQPYSGIGRAERHGDTQRSSSGGGTENRPGQKPPDHPGRGNSGEAGSRGQKPPDHPGRGNSGEAGSRGQKPPDHPGQGNSDGRSSNAGQTNGKPASRPAVAQR